MLSLNGLDPQSRYPGLESVLNHSLQPENLPVGIDRTKSTYRGWYAVLSLNPEEDEAAGGVCERRHVVQDFLLIAVCSPWKLRLVLNGFRLPDLVINQ